ncbi:ras GTPase-activating-like protein rng2 [Histoplasma capsulatum G186AR]|uniref:Ras GTPase-activating-like protein rng2 n=2 Tax=Ajellomyces capsulatus TaxID=5037 RepID=C0NBC6_AJECG|nr:ras GTPase-activating-like protein rng2 [Histoplasma capsulatum G186AR]EEH10967.1 ras GTPase-activating-like protein rng2 [Histoplasma capsulatum G186AR]
MSHLHAFRRSQPELPTNPPSPLRHGSTASTDSSVYSSYSNSLVPSRTSTLSSNSSGGFLSDSNTQKGIVSRIGEQFQRASTPPSAGETYGSIRRSLRPLPQAPNRASPPPERVSRQRSQTMTNSIFQHDSIPNGKPVKIETYDEGGSLRLQENIGRAELESSPYSRRQHIRTQSTPHVPALPTSFTAPELETLQKSSTGHLRTLSRFAQTESEDFAMASAVPSVAGLQGRRRLKRADSIRASKSTADSQKVTASAWTESSWIDKQRQFIQAYEYLCHIGEAKEWIEDVIHRTIPPIVQLEEALRDGVILAEVVQALYPHRTFRIFRHPKLQYRHSDNIALFFQLLREIELPDLFWFEMIDLYEKKNLPKVIHCIHALSWLLYKKGIVDFRIGNLVGQLEFEHHELEQVQRGLDKSGVPMPSFSGMGASFGAEPEPAPEPVESEEDRVRRELHENEAIISDFQSQIRGAFVRLRLGNVMQELWDNESALIDLQSRIRGEWSREIMNYRLSMRRFAVNLQSSARGFLVRMRSQHSEKYWRENEADILMLQSVVRANRIRSDVQLLRTRARKEESGIKRIQAAIRGALARSQIDDQCEQTKDAEIEVLSLQAAVRGMLERHRVSQYRLALEKGAHQITVLQSAIRGLFERKFYDSQKLRLAKMSDQWITLQSIVRGTAARGSFQGLRAELKAQLPSIIKVQSALRGTFLRTSVAAVINALHDNEENILTFESLSRGFLLRKRRLQDQNALLLQNSVITNLQSLSRAAMLRIEIGDLLCELETSRDEVTQLQALVRAMFVRLDVGQVLAELEVEEHIIVDFQSNIRGLLVRQRFAEKQRFYRENMEKVIKVQSFVRAKIQGEAYKSLTSGKNPPVGTIKAFVHLLNDSDFDFDEEIEFERLRKTVVQQVRQNEMADQYITQLDIKIALLVKNKITLDEVVKHQKHFGGHVGALLPNSDLSSKDPFDLKALNKTSRRKLEQYQELFFVLQTQPQYLARLFRRIREQATSEKECERIKHLVMGLFGYSQKRREEYYLIKLLVRSAKEEINHAFSLQDYTRCNAFWNKLFAAYTKSPKDRKFMRDILGQLVKEHIIENTELDLESDPMQIYRSAISNEELRTGRKSRRRIDVPREEAIRDPETRETFIRHLQDLRDIADQFFTSLEEYLPRMPFGVRFVAQQIYEHLLSKFENEDHGYVLQVTGQWVWKNYLYPAVLEPERCSVVDRGLTQEQKRNLGEISKVIAQVASGRLFGNENVYLQPLNSWVGEAIQRLGTIWGKLITVQDAESYFDIDAFNDLYAKAKPTLYIKLSDIFSIHQLVAAEISNICVDPDDPIREAIRDLGSVKSNENELMSVSSSEISLTLTPKLHNVEDPDAEIKALFMETKRCILYIIRVQFGANLMEIMLKTPTEEDEERWYALVRDELSSSSRKRGAYSDSNTLIDIGSMSYQELKSTALENILRLEQAGRISRRNNYQDLLNAIAVDIRTKHRRRIQRQRELESVRLTLERLNDQSVYLEQQLKTYNDYIEQAMITLQNKKGKKRFLMPFTKQWDHERELQRSGRVFKFGSFKYSARNLSEKGVLLYWKGYTERQWDRVDLTISSNEVGVFTIDGSCGNMMIPGANAQIPLDDLLQAQFNNTQFMDFFEGALRVNVNLFLHLIMRKFYNE